MNKILLLGGKPIGSVELVEKAHEKGLYVIVTDYLSKEESPAKSVADETWEISTAEIDLLAEKCREEKVNGVISGVHEFNIEKGILLSKELGLRSFSTIEQWKKCDNKQEFKKECKKCGLRVSEEYSLETIRQEDFPVICKPADSSGSKGFSICRSKDELDKGYQHALDFSPGKKVLIEKYQPYESVIIHYTVIEGEAFFSGMSDKNSLQIEDGGKVMAFQTFHSRHIREFYNALDGKIKKLISNLEIVNGFIWIEAFDNNGEFIMNEMGFRLGGSLTNYPVAYYTGFDQLSFMLDIALGNPNTQPVPLLDVEDRRKYAILPLHVKPGTIKSVNGIEAIKSNRNVYSFVQVHYPGDVIHNWKSAQQVFCYLHLLYESNKDLKSTIEEVTNTLSVIDENGRNILFRMFPTSAISEE